MDGMKGVGSNVNNWSRSSSGIREKGHVLLLTDLTERVVCRSAVLDGGLCSMGSSPFALSGSLTRKSHSEV